LDKAYSKPNPNVPRFFETMVRVNHSKWHNIPKDFRNTAVKYLTHHNITMFALGIKLLVP
jgi:hypothetical protein